MEVNAQKKVIHFTAKTCIVSIGQNIYTGGERMVIEVNIYERIDICMSMRGEPKERSQEYTVFHETL